MEEQCLAPCRIGPTRTTPRNFNRATILLLSTDGITEAENAELEEFGDERLLRSRSRHATEVRSKFNAPSCSR